MRNCAIAATMETSDTTWQRTGKALSDFQLIFNGWSFFSTALSFDFSLLGSFANAQSSAIVMPRRGAYNTGAQDVWPLKRRLARLSHASESGYVISRGNRWKDEMGFVMSQVYQPGLPFFAEKGARQIGSITKCGFALSMSGAASGQH